LRVLVCEFVTGGGLAGAVLPASLAREGDMMLRALVKDLADLPDITVVVTRDGRLPAADLPAEIHRIDAGSDPWTLWPKLMELTDAVWPIAPETDGILERLSNLVLDRGKILLGTRPAAVRLTTSKRQTAEHLAAHGIAVAPTMPLATALADELPQSITGWVVKPDDGAGAEDTRLHRSRAALQRWAATRPDVARFVVQAYLAGAAASLSLLCRAGRATLLSCNSQDVRLEGDRFRYHGGAVGGREDRRTAYEPLAARIAAAVPALWGYAGVDLVETAGGPVVLEINPRLTTTYAGLRRALGVNPAGLVLQLLSPDATAIAPPRHIQQQAVEVASDAR
jgi:predicted ATP-grasp superfamily ATP-dependent carboligase